MQRAEEVVQLVAEDELIGIDRGGRAVAEAGLLCRAATDVA